GHSAVIGPEKRTGGLAAAGSPLKWEYAWSRSASLSWLGEVARSWLPRSHGAARAAMSLPQPGRVPSDFQELSYTRARPSRPARIQIRWPSSSTAAAEKNGSSIRLPPGIVV